MTTTTSLLEQQIAALLCQLEEIKEAERLEAAQKEAEAAVEKTRVEEEQRRLQAEVEAEGRVREACRGTGAPQEGAGGRGAAM